uniref:Fibronectin type-III domain-containing protein n=1 Tax=Acrobeloides nanus TaxID=290746 RepID=A0A914D8R9_9BILA
MNIAPMEETGFLDSFQALLTAELKPDFMAPVRYIIQWKQISPAKSLTGSETKWITSSIENSNTFKVEGLQPGVKYRFMITTISPSGKIGKGIHSDWLEIPSLSSIPQQPVGPLSFKQQYNSDDGVGVVVRWNPIPAILEQQVGQTLPSCHYQIAYANDTFNGIQSFEQSRTFAILSLPSETECEFEVALSNFDLHAREATAKQKFTFTPLGYDPNMSQIANLWLIIAPTSVVLSLCVILRFATYCHSRIKKWVKLSKEKKKTQIEKPVMV